MKHLLVYALSVLLCVSLCACSKGSETDVAVPSDMPSPTPVYHEPYNTIDSLSGNVIDELRSELLDAMNSCSELYLSLDKGPADNTVLSRESIQRMLECFAANGYSAIDSGGEFSMYGYENMERFCILISSAEDISYTYYVIYTGGYISAYRLDRTLGVWHLTTMSGEFDADGNPSIYSQGRYYLSEVRYTDKGRLIFCRDLYAFDENQRSNTAPYTFVKITPGDPSLEAYCERYIEPIGYFENNLFTVDWSEENFGPVDFNSLYAYLFGMYHGVEKLTSYNVRAYYPSIGTTRLYAVPTDDFEAVVKQYFNIDNTVLKNISDFSYSLGGYMFIGYSADFYNVTPRTPTPEVVSCVDNGDGTISLTVDALNPWYGTERAFSHELRVRVYRSGAFEYVSNRLLTGEESILPDTKLSIMLDIERDKTVY